MESQAARDLGKLYAEQAIPFLVERWGQQADLRDISSFYLSSVAWMLANGFVLVLEKAGKAEAEKFIHQALAGMAASIRLKKAPFMASFSGELIALEGEPMPQPQPQPQPESKPGPEPERNLMQTPPPPEPAPAPAAQATEAAVCKCKLEKGECSACLEKLKLQYSELGTFALNYIKEFTAKAKEMASHCIPCGARYSDIVLAGLFRIS